MAQGILATLVDVVSGPAPLLVAEQRFAQMLTVSCEMVVDAIDSFWGKPIDRGALYARDVEVNKLERGIRREVMVHLAGGDRPSGLPLAMRLLCMSKDVERLGDYAKNMVEVSDLGDEPLAEGAQRDELERIALATMKLLEELPQLVSSSDPDVLLARARYLDGKALCVDCERLVASTAKSELTAADAVRVAVAARFHKRIIGHAMNLLSGVLMPVHKLDFFDEASLPR